MVETGLSVDDRNSSKMDSVVENAVVHRLAVSVDFGSNGAGRLAVAESVDHLSNAAGKLLLAVAATVAKHTADIHRVAENNIPIAEEFAVLLVVSMDKTVDAHLLVDWHIASWFAA